MEGDPGRGFQLPELDGISIHTLRMEGDVRPLLFVGLVAISIHTLRMEGDTLWTTVIHNGLYFNPHPPHGG